jgi:hypothetical protein
VLGGALCTVETWLNVEHIASLEGLASPMVFAFACVNIGGAVVPLYAERAARDRAWLRCTGLWFSCLFLVFFSFTTTVDRISGKRDAAEARARHGNERVQLARDAYAEAQKVMAAECTKDQTGKRCRAAEAPVAKAREALAAKPAESPEHGMAKRISAALPFLSAEEVELYQPLLLPLGLQLSGFLMLGFGFAPGSTELGQTRRKKGNRKTRRTRKSNAEYQRDYRERQRAKLTVVK